MIEFLRSSLARNSRSDRLTTGTTMSTTSTKPSSTRLDPSSPFKAHFIESEIDGERVGVTLYDSKGLERHLVDLQLREMTTFIESKFQETFLEEQKVQRAANSKDTHIHVVLLLLDPARLEFNHVTSESAMNGKNSFVNMSRLLGILDEDLDISVIRALQGKTTIIPVISKADTVSTAHMTFLKRTVWDAFKAIKFDPLQSLDLDGDDFSDEDADNARDSSIYGDSLDGQHPTERNGNGRVNGARAGNIRTSANAELPLLPFSVLSPDVYDAGVIGRRFPWGFADPYNRDHCDFPKMKDSIFSDWRDELRDASRTRWYEGWRTSRLNRRGTALPARRDRVSAAKPISNSTAYVATPTKSMSPPNTGYKAAYAPDSGVGEYNTSGIGIAVSGSLNGRPSQRTYDGDMF